MAHTQQYGGVWTWGPGVFSWRFRLSRASEDYTADREMRNPHAYVQGRFDSDCRSSGMVITRPRSGSQWLTSGFG